NFRSDVGADLYTRWLAELPKSAALSLYLHVPYCTKLCHYCGCHTTAVRRQEPLDHYSKQLAAEIDMGSPAGAPHRVAHMHWGGGTPSVLGETRLQALLKRLRDRFDLSGDIEHAIELDPRRLTPAFVQMLARHGVNRASLGVQDFAPHVQMAMGRVQPFEQ